jgi:hypothetical protein
MGRWKICKFKPSEVINAEKSSKGHFLLKNNNIWSGNVSQQKIFVESFKALFLFLKNINFYI